MLKLAGRTVNDALIERADDLGLRIYYSPPLRKLTSGQLARTSCLDVGLIIAHLRQPPDPGLGYTDYRYFGSYQRCPSPYNVPADVPEPQSQEEAVAMLEEARERSRLLNMSSFFADVLWITASEWKAEANEFAVAADVGQDLGRVRPWGIRRAHGCDAGRRTSDDVGLLYLLPNRTTDCLRRPVNLDLVRRIIGLNLVMPRSIYSNPVTPLP